MLEIVAFIAMLGGAKYVADAHQKERQDYAKKRRKMMAPKRHGVAAGKRTERNIAQYWRQQAHAERKKRIASDNSLRSTQSARKHEVSDHEKVRKRMAALFVRIVRFANERRTRMPARLDKIRATANEGRGLE